MNLLDLIRQPTSAAPKLRLEDPEAHDARGWAFSQSANATQTAKLNYAISESTPSPETNERRPSPFDRLATELIVHIFFLGVQSGIDSPNPLRAHRSSFRRTLRLVCRRWNTIVQSHAKLEVWSIVKIEPWTESQWRSIAAGVTSSHLDIRFNPDMYWQPEIPGMPDDTSLSSIPRIPSIRLMMDSHILELLFDYFIPELEMALKHPGVMMELEELEIHNAQSSIPWTWIRLFPSVLSPLKKIRRLSMHSFWIASSGTDDQSTVSLPLLRSLILDAIPEGSLRLLDLLDTPVIENLAVRCIPHARAEWFLKGIPQLSSVRNAVLHNINNAFNFAFILFSVSNVVNLSLSLSSGDPLLSVLRQKDGSRGHSATLTNLTTFRLVALKSTLATVPSVLQARLPHKLQKSWFQDFDEPESMLYIGEELEWLKDNAGFEEAALETFSFSNLANDLP
ncbi:hypothetical protein FRB96_007713 [Tulasnella sp. 330]|nr:hypothetical protein FRB96_007713 [Tulasnella sp. 330]